MYSEMERITHAHHCLVNRSRYNQTSDPRISAQKADSQALPPLTECVTLQDSLPLVPTVEHYRFKIGTIIGRFDGGEEVIRKNG